MNKKDRTLLTDIADKISIERARLEELQTSLQERADNLEEFFPMSDKCAHLQEEADRIQESLDDLDTVCGELTSISEGEGF